MFKLAHKDLGKTLSVKGLFMESIIGMTILDWVD